MTSRTQTRMAIVATVALWVPMGGALGQDDVNISNDSEAAPSEASAAAAGQDEGSSGFWGWVEEKVTVEYPDEKSDNYQRPRGGGGDGGGGDSGGGNGGHGG